MLGRKTSDGFRPEVLLTALDRSLAIIQFDTTGGGAARSLTS